MSDAVASFRERIRGCTITFQFPIEPDQSHSLKNKGRRDWATGKTTAGAAPSLSILRYTALTCTSTHHSSTYSEPQLWQNSGSLHQVAFHPFLVVRGNTMTKDEEMAEVLNAFFASVFSSRTSCSVDTQPPELEDGEDEQNEAPVIQAEMVSDLLQHLNLQRSIGPNGVHPRVLRELVEVLIKPLSIVYQQSWLTEEVSVDYNLANVIPSCKKGWKEEPGNYRPVSLTLVLVKVMEQIILSAIMWHVQDNQLIRPSQHGFMKGRSCLTNLISFYDKVTHYEGRAVGVVYLDFSKAFGTILHCVLLEKLAAHGLDGRMLHWVKKLAGRAQRVVVNGMKSGWRPRTMVLPRAQYWGQFSLISS
ncbi:rna-directed dna polymerase from mobile element jockey-like [Limosa lapponica baueri]|uniref:Rna-directed dna polymerase from mobile element jockey-like n=1 Tax=Limosa lapponica baueri TaxID=1758121 RepID=A0A2I0TD43_LIMLA|nr:rna-directed dna polymerase from mobile element jockey-like [Limosa lapponica baueri]